MWKESEKEERKKMVDLFAEALTQDICSCWMPLKNEYLLYEDGNKLHQFIEIDRKEGKQAGINAWHGHEIQSNK